MNYRVARLVVGKFLRTGCMNREACMASPLYLSYSLHDSKGDLCIQPRAAERKVHDSQAFPRFQLGQSVGEHPGIENPIFFMTRNRLRAKIDRVEENFSWNLIQT